MSDTIGMPPGSRVDLTGPHAALLYVPASPAAQWLRARNVLVGQGWRFRRGPDPVEDVHLGRVLRYDLTR
jgi:hypothetical protein